MTTTTMPESRPMHPEIMMSTSDRRVCEYEYSLNRSQRGLQKLFSQKNCSWHLMVHRVLFELPTVKC